MRRSSKWITGAIVTLGILFSIGTKVQASESYSEQEPNNMIEQAGVINRSTQTAAQAVANDTSGQFFVYGSMVNKDDIDWYKVTLNAGNDNVLTFAHNESLGSSYLEIYDSEGKVVGNNSFEYNNTSGKAFRISVPKTSSYFLKITSDISSFYSFRIGEPVYLVTTYRPVFQEITLLANGTPWVKEIDLSERGLGIPDKAIIYKVNLGGGNSGSTSSREVRCNGNMNWQTTSSYIWDKSFPVTDTYKAAQVWHVKYNPSSFGDKKLTPNITFLYVYPQLPKSEL